jgi:hypothetical protein
MLMLFPCQDRFWCDAADPFELAAALCFDFAPDFL